MAGQRLRERSAQAPAPDRRWHRSSRGFTLVELLVALFVLSLVAVLAWRGLDGMVRTQSRLKERADEVLTLQIGLAQWRADWEAVVTMPGLPAAEWNGQVLRLLRRVEGPSGPAVMVSAWTRRSDEGSNRWRRWQSLPTSDRAEVQAAWRQADLWARNPGATERAREASLMALDDWQVYYFRRDAWVNPQSSDAQTGAASAAAAPGDGNSNANGNPIGNANGSARGRAADDSTSLPEGVRVVLQLPATAAVPGTLTLDWVNPQVGGSKP